MEYLQPIFFILSSVTFFAFIGAVIYTWAQN